MAHCACQDWPMANLSGHEQMTLVNSLILDVGALESRINAALERIQSSDDHDSQMRTRALVSFRDELVASTTRLRQHGLHPDAQGTLW
jgi:hypothetical protein